MKWSGVLTCYRKNKLPGCSEPGDEVFVAGTVIAANGLVQIKFGYCGTLEIERELIGSVHRPNKEKRHETVTPRDALES